MWDPIGLRTGRPCCRSLAYFGAEDHFGPADVFPFFQMSCLTFTSSSTASMTESLHRQVLQLGGGLELGLGQSLELFGRRGLLGLDLVGEALLDGD